MACIAFSFTWRRAANCVPMYCLLRPDVSPAASGRTTRCVATQFWVHRQPADE